MSLHPKFLLQAKLAQSSVRPGESLSAKALISIRQPPPPPRDKNAPPTLSSLITRGDDR